MRFLRLTLAHKPVPIGGSIDRFEVINHQYLTDGTVIELARIESDHARLDSLFEGDPATIDYEVLEIEGDRQLVYHRLRPDENNVAHQFIAFIDAHQLMIVYPMQFDREAGASITLMGTTDVIQEAYRKLPTEIERHVTIERVTESLPALGGLRSLLTERQREVLDAAIDLGYYSIPRQVTSREIADVVGCAPSTASEHLRKIEAHVLSNLTI